MTTTIACLIAIATTTAFIALWFWVVRRELYEKRKMVDAASCQLIASREEYTRARDGPIGERAQEILKRSQSIYRQAVEIYNKTLRKPWNAVPAFFLGYRQKNDGNENKLY